MSLRYSLVAACQLLAALAATLPLCSPSRAQPVLTHHGSPTRAGNYVVPGLTWERAARLRRDPAFDGRVEGQVYAQPLFWRSPRTNRKLLIAATERNIVYALDAETGKVVWRRSLGDPVPRSALPCGDIDPLGITGTPVIEATRGAVYLDAMVMAKEASAPQHLVFGLSLKDGAILRGFPVEVASALKLIGKTFVPRIQNQRGALLIAADTLFIPYGGHYGDCGPYHGWVIGISLSNPDKVLAWSTRGEGGGIWAPGGISYDGQSLFVATGNTKGARQWSDGDAVFRLDASLTPPTKPDDFFVPANWRFLDEADLDMGGTNPLPIDVPRQNGATHFLLALGKDGNAYVLGRKSLGGVGGALATKQVSSIPIRTAPASFSTSDAAFVALQGRGVGCPKQVPDPGLIMLRVKAEPSLTIATAWCGSVDGSGAPIVTTTDGRANPIVWVVGAEGDGRLHGFRGDNGAPIFSEDDARYRVPGVRRFSTILAADGRLFVAGDGSIYGFAP